ncbi:hypothetical protein PENTCL1PPCAC_5853 [Pristionchus entomophagus]|uniref:Peptidase M13 C-terminal domain-containing protein n=1 Tax=Pristionchus entomophagus TaxID=358040 RepID=A0AAV5SNK0_9BILA|nr:hypothetical protein PENTCL1PPCAC_5853 [Pristionchus entomophagus]
MLNFPGRNFGPTGMDQNLTTGQTSKNFEARQTCFREQYSVLGEMRATDDVLAENLADNVALEMTYKAWKKQDELGKKILPGVEYTSDQAFFTAFAQNWCSVSKGASGTHSMGKLRLLLTLQNSRQFSEAFSCPIGSFMNPSKKCSLW